jgi:uncharacterized membrane protein
MSRIYKNFLSDGKILKILIGVIPGVLLIYIFQYPVLPKIAELFIVNLIIYEFSKKIYKTNIGYRSVVFFVASLIAAIVSLFLLKLNDFVITENPLDWLRCMLSSIILQAAMCMSRKQLTTPQIKNE